MSKYKVGIVGAGTMGSGVAQKLAQEGFEVVMVDMKEEFVEKGINNIKETLDEGIERGIFSREQVDEIMSRVKSSTRYEDVADADLVIEAVFEDMKVKSEVFEKLDKACGPNTIIATNTSSLSVAELAACTNRPEKVLGLHYFYHPAKNRMLEIVPHNGTSLETVEKVQQIANLHGKSSITVKDAPGFAVNRFFIPWYITAMRIVEEGIANIPTVDEASKRAFGVPMGVFELQNVSGIQIGLHAARTLAKERGTFYEPPEILRRHVEDLNQNFDLGGEVDESKMDIVKDKMFAAVFGVAATMVDEGVTTKEDADRGAKIALRWRKGPFELMNEVGIEKAYQLVKELSQERSDFEIPELLKKQYEKGEPFEFELVEMEVKGDIAYIVVNRPEAMNALNPVVVDQLEKKYKEAENNSAVKGIVLRGAGKAFIAGADIKFFVDNIENNTVDQTMEFTWKAHDLLNSLENSSKMTIALLDGLSLGGGSEVALACQAIVATRHGSFGFPEAGIGIYPGMAGMIRLARHVGPELAKYYVMTGENISAQEAYDLGIVTRLVEPTEVDSAIREIVDGGKFDKYAPRSIPGAFQEKKKAAEGENAERLVKQEAPQGVDQDFAEKVKKMVSKKSQLALKDIHELIDQQQDLSIKEAIKIEMSRQEEMFARKDAYEGLTSQLEGRKPTFKGE